MLPERLATLVDSSVRLQRFGRVSFNDRVAFQTEQIDRSRVWQECVESQLRQREEVYGATTEVSFPSTAGPLAFYTVAGVRSNRELAGDFVERHESRDERRLHELKAAVCKVDSEYDNYTVTESSLDYVPDPSTVQVIRALSAAENTAKIRCVVGFVHSDELDRRAEAASGRQTLSRAQQEARQRVQAKVVPISLP